MKPYIILRIIVLMALLTFACVTTTTTPTPELAGEELIADSPTETDIPEIPTDTPIPEPTDTPTLVPSDTPIPTDTATPTPDLAATEAFEATKQAEDLLSAIGPIMESINLSTDQGYLGWVMDEPVTFSLNTYREYMWKSIDPDQEFSNFVFHADVTWESTSGYILCGYVFRGGPNLDYDPYYIFQSIRWSGWPSWDVEYFKYGKFQSSVTGGVRRDTAINQDQGSMNKFIIVANGTVFHGYVNGESLGGATISKLNKGLVGFYGWQESGKTTCKFENAWLWVLDDK